MTDTITGTTAAIERELDLAASPARVGRGARTRGVPRRWR